MRIRNGEINVSSEEKCLQRRLETVQGRRVANGARQPVPCRRLPLHITSMETVDAMKMTTADDAKQPKGRQNGVMSSEPVVLQETSVWSERMDGPVSYCV